MIISTITKNYQLLTNNTFILLFCIICPFAAADRLAVVSPTIELRNQLNRKIDSLDIEKQLRKCNGQNIDDVEQQQNKLLDSIKSIRIAIQNEAAVLEKNLKTNNNSISISTILNPQNIFDWVIIITCSIAIVSLLFLIFGIFILISKNRKKKQLPSLKNKKTPSNPNKPVGKMEKIDSSSNQNIELLNQLKRKIIEKQANSETQSPHPPTQILKTTPLQSEQVLTNNLEGQILKAYQNGSDIQEISRQFHISVDHASLILKIKGVAPQK